MGNMIAPSLPGFKVMSGVSFGGSHPDKRVVNFCLSASPMCWVDLTIEAVKFTGEVYARPNGIKSFSEEVPVHYDSWRVVEPSDENKIYAIAKAKFAQDVLISVGRQGCKIMLDAEQVCALNEAIKDLAVLDAKDSGVFDGYQWGFPY